MERPKHHADESILSPSILNTIQQAISTDPIVCLHRVWRGGGAAHELVFGTFEAWTGYVSRAKPGDLFYLWSIQLLRRQGLLLIDNAISAGTSQV